MQLIIIFILHAIFGYVVLFALLPLIINITETSICNAKFFFFLENFVMITARTCLLVFISQKIIKLLFTSLGGHIEKNCAFYLENCLRSHDLGNSFSCTDLLAGQ